MALGAYLAAENESFWLWAADSAFRGTRAPADFRLGVVSIVAAPAPLAVGTVVIWLGTIRIDGHLEEVTGPLEATEPRGASDVEQRSG